MNKFFVQIIGPYDTSMVGPFDTDVQAQAFKATVPARFNAWVITKEKLDEQFNEFGLMPIETPDAYDFGKDYIKGA